MDYPHRFFAEVLEAVAAGRPVPIVPVEKGDGYAEWRRLGPETAAVGPVPTDGLPPGLRFAPIPKGAIVEVVQESEVAERFIRYEPSIDGSCP